MRYLVTLFVLMFTLGFGGQALAEEYDTTADDAMMESSEEFSAFEANDAREDEWGVYDEDFVWETEDSDVYDDWYGDVSDYWNDYEYWGYDDPGEAGFWDW